MRKRPTLIVAIAVAAATAIAASVAIAGPLGAGVTTPNGNTQSVGSLITPKKLSKTTFTPAALEVTTKLTTSASSGVPNPTVRVVVDFDKNAKIFTKGIPTCDPAKVQSVSTEIAEQQCGKAKIGSGKATALLPVGTQVFTANQTVTAFNGVPEGGKPVIILHTYGTTPIQTTLVLVGAVTNFNKEGYGPRLDLEVPKIAGGAGALTGFQVKVDRKWTYKGQKRSFISAKCPNSKKLKARGQFIFIDGESSTPTSVQTCKPKK
ncbi:MAG: hypothetical protein WD810_08665 [Solirubrobacterales bacterium]